MIVWEMARGGERIRGDLMEGERERGGRGVTFHVLMYASVPLRSSRL